MMAEVLNVVYEAVRAVVKYEGETAAAHAPTVRHINSPGIRRVVRRNRSIDMP
jgi:hypothetical protein